MKRIFVENTKHRVIVTLDVSDADTAYIERDAELKEVSRYHLELRNRVEYLADRMPELNAAFLAMKKTLSDFPMNTFESVFPFRNGEKPADVSLRGVEHVKDIPSDLSLLNFIAFLSTFEMDLVIKPRDVKFNRVLDVYEHSEEQDPYCAPDSEEHYHYRMLKLNQEHENK